MDAVLASLLCDPALVERAADDWKELSVVGAANRVWATSDGGGAVLKLVDDPAKARRERRGLGVWAPAAGVAAPRLLASELEREPRALLMTRLVGGPVETRALTAGERADLHRAMGASLRRLHELPLADEDPLPLAEALRRRTEAALAGGPPPGCPASLFARAERRLLDHVWTAGPRRAAHRDFRERNWWIGDDGSLAVFDFEHARPDDPMVDLVRLRETDWRAEPALEAAFREGYGGPDATEEARLEILEIVHALGTLRRPAGVGGVTFVDAARAVLERRLGG
ncbi:MAG: aminoglycoside phosphotransferase family protein [Planctomycetota bacterium]